jgi:hypothetical protein
MRLFLLALAVIVPLAAHAQAPKQVEVINDPLAVEVVNEPAACEVREIQLVGFTTPYTGNLGGILGATRKCSDEFPDSRMCEIDEIRQSTRLPNVIPPLAWMTPLGGGCPGDQIIDGVETTNPVDLR